MTEPRVGQLVVATYFHGERRTFLGRVVEVAQPESEGRRARRTVRVQGVGPRVRSAWYAPGDLRPYDPLTGDLTVSMLIVANSREP